jgi:hypothetical protein
LSNPFEALQANGSAENQPLSNELVIQISPRVQTALGRVVAQVATDPAERPQARAVADGWVQFQQLLRRGALTGSMPKLRASAAWDVSLVRSHYRCREGDRRHRECPECAGTSPSAGYLPLRGRADVDRWSALLAVAGVVFWLIRTVLPRTVACAAFATDRSHGRYELCVELAQLGRVLDDSAQRRRAQDTYDRNQLELLGGLQTAESTRPAICCAAIWSEWSPTASSPSTAATTAPTDCRL